MEIFDLIKQALKTILPVLPIIFKAMVLVAIVLFIFGPLFKWGWKVIKDLKKGKET